eukprot:5252668-Amphidinium_carterae.1
MESCNLVVTACSRLQARWRAPISTKSGDREAVHHGHRHDCLVVTQEGVNVGMVSFSCMQSESCEACYLPLLMAAKLQEELMLDEAAKSRVLCTHLRRLLPSTRMVPSCSNFSSAAVES